MSHEEALANMKHIEKSYDDSDKITKDNIISWDVVNEP